MNLTCILKYKKSISAGLLIAVLILAYGYLFPTTYQFKCMGLIQQQDAENVLTKTLDTRYIKVSKYLYGAKYTLNGYSKSECEGSDEEIACYSSAPKSEDWLAFNYIRRELSGSELWISATRSVVEKFFITDCEKISSALE